MELTGLMRVVRVQPLTDEQWVIGVEIEKIPPDHQALLEQYFR